MNNDIFLDGNKNNELDLFAILSLFWKKKVILIISTATSIIFTLIYLLFLPNQYDSNAVLAPTNQSDSMSSILGSYSSLAGFAGVSLPSDSSNKSIEAIERLKSFDFFNNNILPNIRLEHLYASKWNPEKNLLTYNTNFYNSIDGSWNLLPSSQESFEIFEEIFAISENKKTGFVTLSISHVSPYVAKNLLDLIIFEINESMREIDKKIAQDAIDFLNNQAEITRYKELKDATSKLLESQMQNLMMASISDGYIYKTINTPVANEKPSSPNKLLIIILGSLFGFALGIAIILFRFMQKN
jgi:hypothetical protein